MIFTGKSADGSDFEPLKLWYDSESANFENQN